MPDNDGKLVPVTGATGRQGNAVLRHLLERGRPVRALTRRPDSPAARAALRRDYARLRLRALEDWLREEGWAGRRAVTVRRDKIGRPLPDTPPPTAPDVAR